MIRSVSSDRESFETLTFGPGLNGSRPDNETEVA